MGCLRQQMSWDDCGLCSRGEEWARLFQTRTNDAYRNSVIKRPAQLGKWWEVPPWQNPEGWGRREEIVPERQAEGLQWKLVGQAGGNCCGVWEQVDLPGNKTLPKEGKMIDQKVGQGTDRLRIGDQIEKNNDSWGKRWWNLGWSGSPAWTTKCGVC